MSRKSPSQSKILNDTLDLMTLMTHCVLGLTFAIFVGLFLIVSTIIFVIMQSV